MFNEQLKRQAIADLENSNRQYVMVFRKTVNGMESLYRARTRAVKTISGIEHYIIHLANKPREYETELGEINVRYTEFNNKIQEIRSLEEKEQQINYSSGVGTGILVGIGGTAFAPTAAMAVAMTFGTASTGTAIASLSGIAATNAALAWLGGGALAAGGAGIAGGQALITMAGPIGWVIGGTALAGSAILKSKNNADIAEQAENATKTILKEKNRMQKIDGQVQYWTKETIKLTVELSKKLTLLRRKRDYTLFTDDEKRELALLMNMTEVLSKKLGEKIA